MEVKKTTTKKFHGSEGLFTKDIGLDEERDGTFSILVSSPEGIVARVYGKTPEEATGNAQLFSRSKELLQESMKLIRQLDDLHNAGKPIYDLINISPLVETVISAIDTDQD